MFPSFTQGDENSAERRLNSAFRIYSGVTPYGVSVIELQLAARPTIRGLEITPRFEFAIFDDFEEKKKEEIK
jgi:hypothetical protein